MYLLDLKDESCAKSILEVLQSSVGSGLRILALSQLSRFQHLSPSDSQRVTSIIVNNLADAAPDVRIAASNALSYFPSPLARSSLETAILKEQDPAVRSLMASDLQRLQGAGDAAKHSE
jgi:hypothetical protein